MKTKNKIKRERKENNTKSNIHNPNIILISTLSVELYFNLWSCD